MISFKEKFSYGLGDASANIFMGMTMMFLTIYYTDVFRLNPVTMGTLFLITRVMDAISDPLIGMFADKTKHRYGRYRPWLLWFAIPYGLSCAAVFFSPELPDSTEDAVRLRHLHLPGSDLLAGRGALRVVAGRHLERPRRADIDQLHPLRPGEILVPHLRTCSCQAFSRSSRTR